jgi:hypothetical protein
MSKRAPEAAQCWRTKGEFVDARNDGPEERAQPASAPKVIVHSGSAAMQLGALPPVQRWC